MEVSHFQRQGISLGVGSQLMALSNVFRDELCCVQCYCFGLSSELVGCPQVQADYYRTIGEYGRSCRITRWRQPEEPHVCRWGSTGEWQRSCGWVGTVCPVREWSSLWEFCAGADAVILLRPLPALCGLIVGSWASEPGSCSNAEAWSPAWGHSTGDFCARAAV